MMGMIRALTIFAILWGSSIASAAVVQVSSEAEIIQSSDAIVMGTVASVSAHIQPQGGVITTAEIRVFRSLRGVSPGATVSVVVPGGKLKNGMTSYVAGAPIPEVGEWVVLLLESKADVWTPQGLSLGWIQLQGSEAKGFVAYRELNGLSLVGESGAHVASEPYRIRALDFDRLWLNLKSSLKPMPLPGNNGVTP